MMSDVSIIIVNYNTANLTMNCLRSIYDMVEDVKFEIIVVDNASTDGSQEQIKNQFPQIKLIVNTENIGFGRANNVGIRASDSKYVFLLNSDTTLLNNAVKIFFDFMEKDTKQEVACCGGQLHTKDISMQLSFGRFPSIKNVAIHSFVTPYKILRHLFNVDEVIATTVIGLIVVDYVSGADMFIRRNVLKEVGLFNEEFFLYYEETELSYRFNKHGYKSMLLPDAKIVHLYGMSTDKENNLDIMNLYGKSELLYFEKCHGRISTYLVKFIYVVSGIINCLFKRDGKYLRHALLISKLKV